MTAQVSERLVYRGETVALFSNPLTPYLKEHGKIDMFQMATTANRRGYVGCWEIAHDRLYLSSLAGKLKSGEAASLKTLFPKATGPVFADWFSGSLRVPQGERLQYVHIGYASTYERDMLLEISNGMLVATTIQENDADKPERRRPSGGPRAISVRA